jgi:hypothetical protein
MGSRKRVGPLESTNDPPTLGGKARKSTMEVPTPYGENGEYGINCGWNMPSEFERSC